MTDQLRLDGNDQLTTDGDSSAPVECMGMTFESDRARREFFLGALAQKLKDPQFRMQPGFPIGQDEDILRMSDPPYYTACPNPFLEEYVRAHGRPYDSQVSYHRDPFAVDVSVGKTDALYRAHGYHTKVPHLAIVPSILHYTQPGDIVLDGFCGSGMTGVAAQFCGTAPTSYRNQIESEWRAQGLDLPQWGARRAILGDLSPAATFIAAGYNTPFDVNALAREAQRILDEMDIEIGWMYETHHTDGSKCRINYTVWSESFTCPDCGAELVFFDIAFDRTTYGVRDKFTCDTCGAALSKRVLIPYEVSHIGRDGRPIKGRKRVPVLINYQHHGATLEKRPDQSDLEVIGRVGDMGLPPAVPTASLELDRTWEAARLRERGIEYVDQLFLPRQAQALGALWSKAVELDAATRAEVLFAIEQSIPGMSLLNRYQPIQQGRPGGSQVNRQMSGVYYVSSLISEVSPWYNLKGKLSRLATAMDRPTLSTSVVQSCDCSHQGLPSSSVDYVFTDPPFGDNLPYSELNAMVEHWHRVVTAPSREAVVDRAKRDASAQKGLDDYSRLLADCFNEYARVLKPGRWMTVVFSNSRNTVWRAIQEAIASAGFVVADVRTLDKQQGSFKQVTNNAVKQDLIISAYKPSESLAASTIDVADAAGAWAFVAEHLRNVPIAVGAGPSLETVVERTSQMLHDRMIGFFVQRGLAVPLSTAEFMSGLAQRYPERDGMYFLPEQIAEYDKRRAKADSVQQLSLIVTDESSAIQWVRQQLEQKPQPFSELQPTFMREAQQSWAKHETHMELRDLLEQNFLMYEGGGPVPSQIKSYLSTNWREFRNLEATDASLQAKAKDRWYVPEPGKSVDLERLRERQLLKEFEHYRTSAARRLKLFRTEAVRAGFKRAYDERDWETIVSVAGRLPEAVVQEDEKLLMYYDVARMRIG